MARCIVLKPRIDQFQKKEPCYRVAISSTVNSCCLTTRVFKKVCSDNYFCSKSAPNGDALWVRLFFANHAWVPQTRQFCRLTKPKSKWKRVSSLRIISLEKPASTFRRLIIHPFHVVVSCNAPFSPTPNSQLSQTVLFSGLPTTRCKNGGKFKSCVNFGTPFVYIFDMIKEGE